MGGLWLLCRVADVGDMWVSFDWKSAFSTNGGASFGPNIQISGGTSNSHDSGNDIDYGDDTGLSYYGGTAHPAWSDNSNSSRYQPGRSAAAPSGHLHRGDSPAVADSPATAAGARTSSGD